jgi:hypothetical protein
MHIHGSLKQNQIYSDTESCHDLIIGQQGVNFSARRREKVSRLKEHTCSQIIAPLQQTPSTRSRVSNALHFHRRHKLRRAAIKQAANAPTLAAVRRYTYTQLHWAVAAAVTHPAVLIDGF